MYINAQHMMPSSSVNIATLGIGTLQHESTTLQSNGKQCVQNLLSVCTGLYKASVAPKYVQHSGVIASSVYRICSAYMYPIAQRKYKPKEQQRVLRSEQCTTQVYNSEKR